MQNSCWHVAQTRTAPANSEGWRMCVCVYSAVRQSSHQDQLESPFAAPSEHQSGMRVSSKAPGVERVGVFESVAHQSSLAEGGHES